MTLKRLYIILGILIFLAGVGIAWLWQYAYTPEGRAMRKALDYLLAPERQDATGYYGRYDGARMYGHGIVTLMLAEMVGMGVDARQDEVIRDRCQKAVDLIVRESCGGKQTGVGPSALESIPTS